MSHSAKSTKFTLFPLKMCMAKLFLVVFWVVELFHCVMSVIALFVFAILFLTKYLIIRVFLINPSSFGFKMIKTTFFYVVFLLLLTGFSFERE